jgi:hypothetical protein
VPHVIVENVSTIGKSAAKKAADLLVLQNYPGATQVFAGTRAVVVDNVSRVQAWKGNLTVLGTGPNALNADIFIGQDTYGWPIEAFEPPTFGQVWKYSAVILNSFSTYNVATDRRARQSVQFFEPEVFLKAWTASQVVVNTFTPYVPSHDVQRARQAYYYQEQEVFSRPQPYNALIINGTASFAILNIPPWVAAWTADSTAITADSTKFTADGADLINGGGLSIREKQPFENGGLVINVDYNLRF